MAFQTNVFRGGEWVTETVDLHTFLKSQANATKGPAKEPLLKPPRCGLLTRTLVESPVANSILPVRLRSPQNNDIAFVGDHFVQICELRKDGRLNEVARKNDFGSRIRNACVVGTAVIPEVPHDDDLPESPSLAAVKTEDDEPRLSELPSQKPLGSTAQLPPQLLMVVLESGDNVFMFVRPGPAGEPEFVTSRFANPRHVGGQLGFHLAIDPSSRYMVLADATECFAVYELESIGRLNQAYASNSPLNPVKSYRYRTVRGVIQKVAFLHPQPGEDHHIILVLVIVRARKTRLAIYDWELGEDLRTVFAEEKGGYRMPFEFQMVLQLIPLTVQSAFIAISPQQTAVCTGCLYGPPQFDLVSLQAPDASSSNHRGLGPPLWTSWARPFRSRRYNRTRDCIYLAREDGVVLYIQADQDCALNHITLLEKTHCSISSAFACVVHQCTDALMLGSDSGPGGFWKVPPRKPVEKLGILPNWSPVVDFATTDEFSGWYQNPNDDKVMVPWQQAGARNPDRIFATCQGGANGFITEYRYGLRADIGLDLEYGAGMKQAWLLPSHGLPSLHGYLLLISMPDRSTALHLPHDFSSASELAADTIPYDLSSTTLAASCSSGLIIQITRQSIVWVAQGRSNTWFSWRTLPGLSNAFVCDACIRDDRIAISAHTDVRFQIHIFRVDTASRTLGHVQKVDVDGEVTCLSPGPAFTFLAGIREESRTLLVRGSLIDTGNNCIAVDLTDRLTTWEDGQNAGEPPLTESIASIVAVQDTILVGSRAGDLMLITDPTDSPANGGQKLGMTAVNLSCSYGAGATDPTILVCCDNKLIFLGLNQHGSCRDAARLKSVLRVLPVDASKLDAMPPPVHFAAAVDMPSEDGVTPILMISGSRLLLAELHREPSPVHRYIPVSGVPNRIIYSQSTQSLVVAATVTRDDKPTLLFVDPNTGDSVGQPTDKNKAPVDYISGLGKPGDRIMGLTEWNYRRDGKVWNFILVATRGGRLVVVSTQKTASRDSAPPAIRYWTRSKEELKEPIHSVVGYDEGVICCVGETIQWKVLDVRERALKPFKSFRLNSPATSLRISNGKLLALTSRESLVVLDHTEGDGPSARLLHEDAWTRKGVDLIEVAGPQTDEPLAGIVLVADRDCGVAALWVPWQTPEKEFEVVLEAELPVSIRRFGRARTWASWELLHRRPKYGRLAATVDDAEILGVSLNGSLHHFTVLSLEAWRFLRFIQNLALTSEELCPYRRLRGHRPIEDVEPRADGGLEMQVDGGILQRCLDQRALERLITRPEHLSRFQELLRALDGVDSTAALIAEEVPDRYYFELAYTVLRYYLRPVF